MMKMSKFYFIFFLLITLNGLNSAPISSSQAFNVARKQLQLSDLERTKTKNLQLHSILPERDARNLRLLDSRDLGLKVDYNSNLYVIVDSTGGFVVVSGDDRATPILAVSTDTVVDPNNCPPAFVSWMKHRQKQIEHLIASNQNASSNTQSAWEQLLTEKPTSNSVSDSVGPLLETSWGQGTYYNNECPTDTESGDNAPTGCVATAMAQIMNYWEYPDKSYGSSNYNNEHYGNIAVNIEESVFDWAHMPNKLSDSSSQEEINAVSNLMAVCGAAVEMEYNPDGSGSYGYKALKALNSHFNFGSTATLIKRSETTNSLWIATLKHELEKGRPIYYRGIDLFTAGHAWICDGYDVNGRFHMNWGWDGNFNGFFTIKDEIEVDGLNFEFAQHAIVGIAPQAFTNVGQNLVLGSTLNVVPNPAEAWQGFYPHYAVQNIGETAYTATFAIGLFDENNNFLRTLNDTATFEVQPKQNPQLIHFYTNSNDWVAPGTYYISAVFRPSPNHRWAKLGGEGQQNRTKLVISNSTAMDEELTLNSDFQIGGNQTLKQGTPFNVLYDVRNSSKFSFSGGIGSILYDYNTGGRMEGYLFRDDAQSIESNESLNLSFQIDEETGDIPAGDYLAVLYHYQNGEEYWQMTNSGNYAAAKKISITPGPDRFEPNEWDYSGDYARFTATFDYTNTYKLRPWCTSIHSASDKDHFYVRLPEGYDYTVDAEVFDSSNPEEDYTYTTDVGFFALASNEENMRGHYDDVMPLPMKIEDGGYAFFGVRGWGTDTGSYKLEVNVTRHERGETDIHDPRNYVTPLYRFYREGNESHFFTANESEKESVEPFLEYEGISQHVLHAMVYSATPVYRMFNNISKSHFYTASEAELESIQQNLSHVYSLEGIAFYAMKYPWYNAKPVYRFYSPKTASHFFTISETEKDQIIQTIPESVLKYDGIAWYAFH